MKHKAAKPARTAALLLAVLLAWHLFSVFAEQPAGLTAFPTPAAAGGTSVAARTAKSAAEKAQEGILPLALWYEELTSESVVIRWDRVAGAAGYSVFRTRAESGEYEPLREDTPELQYTDTDLTGGMSFFYMVIACDAAGEEIAVSDSLAVEVPLRIAGTAETTETAETAGEDAVIQSAGLPAAILRTMSDPMTAALGIAIIATGILLIILLVVLNRLDRKGPKRRRRRKRRVLV